MENLRDSRKRAEIATMWQKGKVNSRRAFGQKLRQWHAQPVAEQ